jgi:hypothetical protein
MQITIKGFITCKRAEQYIDCADNYAVNKNSHRFSISDGVSRSFFPKIWSEILVTQYVERTDLKENELIKVCQNEWQERIDEIVSLPDTKWFTKTQYNRKDPALATFVGLQFFEKEKKWTSTTRGDSFLFFVPTDYKDYHKDLVKLSSKAEPIVFDNFPDYLTSIGESHRGRSKVKYGNLRNGTFYLMTDALAEWFINEGKNAPEKIKYWKSQAEFERFISQEIDKNLLTNDDCAILCIELSEANRKGIEYNKIQVTDLSELINNQKAKIEKIKHEKLKNEKIEQEKGTNILKSNELETLKKESITSENLVKQNKENSPKEGLLSKVFGLLSRNEKEDIIEILPDQKVDSEIEESIEQNSGLHEKNDDELIDQETNSVAINNDENEKYGELEKEKTEKITYNAAEKTEYEKKELKEKLEIDSKAKSIFDKF